MFRYQLPCDSNECPYIRQIIKCWKAVSGKLKSVTSEMVDRWWETSLPTLLSNYELKDIYNAGEFGLFYECFQNETYQLKSEKCSGEKLNKYASQA